eukprot:TRINITY_DN3550_c0_g1_i1.p1 TRINITY_DN3550_c0_g1~~TRINITY_DN3550_c0_g1_i1.p1  ORF type:complete len:836 (-),score=218.75 TRINITY_DN3550_c0_g1_i1:211-2718(-)
MEVSHVLPGESSGETHQVVDIMNNEVKEDCIEREPTEPTVNESCNIAGHTDTITIADQVNVVLGESPEAVSSADEAADVSYSNTGSINVDLNKDFASPTKSTEEILSSMDSPDSTKSDPYKKYEGNKDDKSEITGYRSELDQPANATSSVIDMDFDLYTDNVSEDINKNQNIECLDEDTAQLVSNFSENLNLQGLTASEPEGQSGTKEEETDKTLQDEGLESTITLEATEVPHEAELIVNESLMSSTMILDSQNDNLPEYSISSELEDEIVNNGGSKEENVMPNESLEKVVETDLDRCPQRKSNKLIESRITMMTKKIHKVASTFLDIKEQSNILDMLENIYQYTLTLKEREELLQYQLADAKCITEDAEVKLDKQSEISQKEMLYTSTVNDGLNDRQGILVEMEAELHKLRGQISSLEKQLELSAKEGEEAEKLAMAYEENSFQTLGKVFDLNNLYTVSQSQHKDLINLLSDFYLSFCELHNEYVEKKPGELSDYSKKPCLKPLTASQMKTEMEFKLNSLKEKLLAQQKLVQHADSEVMHLRKELSIMSDFMKESAEETKNAFVSTHAMNIEKLLLYGKLGDVNILLDGLQAEIMKEKNKAHKAEGGLKNAVKECSKLNTVILHEQLYKKELEKKLEQVQREKESAICHVGGTTKVINEMISTLARKRQNLQKKIAVLVNEKDDLERRCMESINEKQLLIQTYESALEKQKEEKEIMSREIQNLKLNLEKQVAMNMVSGTEHQFHMEKGDMQNQDLKVNKSPTVMKYGSCEVYQQNVSPPTIESETKHADQKTMMVSFHEDASPYFKCPVLEIKHMIIIFIFSIVISLFVAKLL